MIPWEREIYVLQLQKYLDDERKKIEAQRNRQR